MMYRNPAAVLRTPWAMCSQPFSVLMGVALSPDGLHPNDFGHSLAAGEISRLLEHVNAHRKEPEAGPKLPALLTANAYENARRLTIREISPKLEGFRADTPDAAEFYLTALIAAG